MVIGTGWNMMWWNIATICHVILTCHSQAPSTRRSLGFAAASFELNDRAVYEDYLSGIGFAYSLALWARVCRFVTWFNI